MGVGFGARGCAAELEDVLGGTLVIASPCSRISMVFTGFTPFPGAGRAGEIRHRIALNELIGAAGKNRNLILWRPCRPRQREGAQHR
jgi:hypothetical protein